ncbi:hypothetical protein DFH08DRAFT_975565 [Mycena albidolilacea]|uniref:Uncharacterized protein n=1 Tax=Mycena albidolilacea TaxID=1033008 RepID=A0AAD7EAN3_9AGAR|nr:hypothetical protein DFH08DRAFT_975565 [Mycena albidolilacea]
MQSTRWRPCARVSIPFRANGPSASRTILSSRQIDESPPIWVEGAGEVLPRRCSGHDDALIHPRRPPFDVPQVDASVVPATTRACRFSPSPGLTVPQPAAWIFLALSKERLEGILLREPWYSEEARTGGREGREPWCSPAVGAAYRTRASAAAAAGRTGRDAGVGQGRVGEYGGWMERRRGCIFENECRRNQNASAASTRHVSSRASAQRAGFADTPLPPTLQPHAQMRSAVER